MPHYACVNQFHDFHKQYFQSKKYMQSMHFFERFNLCKNFILIKTNEKKGFQCWKSSNGKKKTYLGMSEKGVCLCFDFEKITSF